LREDRVRIPSGTDRPADQLLGRDELLEVIGSYLRHGTHVLLVGPPDVGKTALIGALVTHDVVILDPFERVSSHAAARIRQAMDHGVIFLAGTRSLSRDHLGAVRRIAWRFATVRVPPLHGHWMKRLMLRECIRLELPGDVVTPPWTRSVMQLSRGRPGLALAILQAAAGLRAVKGSLPSPAAAYIEARIRRARVAGIKAAGQRGVALLASSERPAR
jgi:hypothetical protein